MKSSVEFAVVRILSLAWDKEMCFLCFHDDLSVCILKETACIRKLFHKSYICLGLQILSLCSSILMVKVIDVIDLLIRQKLPLSNIQKHPSL